MLTNHVVLTMSFVGSTNDLSTPLRRLAGTCHLPIGFEASAPDTTSLSSGEGFRAARVSVEKGTWRDVLNALVGAAPAYIWEEVDGVVNVSPREKEDSLPNVAVRSFEVENLNSNDALRRLTNTREVQRWLKRTGLEQKDFSTFPITDGGRSRTLSLALANVTVKTILNAILTGSGRYYWTYFRYGRDNRFFSLTSS
jgi:hypothetical protein